MKQAKRKNLPQKTDAGKPDVPAQKTDAGKPDVQGEGDYDATRRHRQRVEAFLESNDPEQLARSAAPADPHEEKELEDAEQRGRDGPADDTAQDIARRDRPRQSPGR